MPTLPGQPQSTIASWSATIVRALDAQGLDGPAIAARAGIEHSALADADARVPRPALTRLWRLAVEETGNPAFGLIAARHTLQTTFHALGYAVLASSTLREAVERIVRYRRLIGDVIQLRLEDDGDAARFLIDVSQGGGAVPDEAVDALIAVTVRQASMLQGDRSFRPLSISMQRPAPADASPWEHALRAPVHFAQATTYIEFSCSDLDRRLPAANAELARQNDEVVVRYLARHAQSQVLVKARHALLDSLPGGAPSRSQIARRLGTSPRNLQRLLAAEGTSFVELLADARLSLARSYLDEGRLPVTEIGFVLGFADTSAFSRAFKRWTGMSPSEYARRTPRATQPG